MERFDMFAVIQHDQVVGLFSTREGAEEMIRNIAQISRLLADSLVVKAVRV